ncbi:MAG: TlyA family RNA methyltransferase [Bdellovibrionales bacterium]|nr:TlyA family RNA methyltransferase [Bdellovibrionales bacterium]
MKKRLDVLLLERGLATTRQRAQGLIMSGCVLVSDVPATKPGQPVPVDAEIRVRGAEHPFVSRGALKIVAALDEFQISVENRLGLDIGASTGGFTEVLLQRGAKRVIAIDVGHNQMDWKIRNDPRVHLLEKTNARHLEFAQIGERVDVIVVDVSFISLDKILPALLQFSSPEKTDWVTLVKPQFEVGRDKVGKGGVVTSDADRQEAIARITVFAEQLGLQRRGLIESPITGTDGNKEFLAWWRQSP